MSRQAGNDNRAFEQEGSSLGELSSQDLEHDDEESNLVQESSQTNGQLSTCQSPHQPEVADNQEGSVGDFNLTQVVDHSHSPTCIEMTDTRQQSVSAADTVVQEVEECLTDVTERQSHQQPRVLNTGQEDFGESMWFTATSPYTYRLSLVGGASSSDSTHFPAPALPSVDTESHTGPPAAQTLYPHTSDDQHLEETIAPPTYEENVVTGSPPIGHHGDFYWTDGLGWEDAEEVSEDEDNALYEEKIVLADKSTLFGRLQTKLLPKPTHRVNNKDSRAQARNGIRLADHLTKVPLSKIWHGCTEFWAIAVFLANVVVALMDIVRDARFLYYKVTVLALGVVENIVVVGLWAVSKHPWFKGLANYEQRLKHFQYVENILHELLILPLLILNIVGFATERMYQKPNSAFGWVQLVLLAIDTCEVVFTQVVRLYMLYKFMKDIKKVLRETEADDDKPASGSCCGKPFAGYVLWRAYFTFVGNIILLLTLCTMLGLQVHRDNLVSGNYRASVSSGLLIMSLVLLPIFSIILFILANAYWILEILIELNLTVGNDKEFSSQLRESYGGMVHGALQYAQEKIPASSKRLSILRNTANMKKALYAVLDVPIMLCIFVYEVLLIVSVSQFSGFSVQWANLMMRSIFLAVFVIANFHLVILMLLSNISVILIAVCALVYPFTVPLCCRKKHKVNGNDANY